MQTWHDGLPTPGPQRPPLPDRPRLRARPEPAPTMDDKAGAVSFTPDTDGRTQILA
ncbi:hypothetical protein QO014_004592 [Kaistia dalseonensis]|uniref:Uncharacterized protein n=1 Tax=Kaistia dalseonensis TaxID=410840 RepID=A0ABU0HCY4_9HYPH|nr:hypothetical protein [Kaistia dalseonensis]